MSRNNILYLFLSGFFILFIIGCATMPSLTPEQKKDMTSKLFECPYENVYRATLTVLQDQGYIIKNTDMDSGLIRAASSERSNNLERFWQDLLSSQVRNQTIVEADCMVNKINDNSAEVRINLQETWLGQTSSNSKNPKEEIKNVDQIFNPQVYQKFFDEISKEITKRATIQNKSTKIE
jgi:hypothetical protein